MHRCEPAGYRIPRSDGCASVELYAVMKSCWNENPAERPDFEDLVDQIQDVWDMDDVVEVNQSHKKLAIGVDTTPQPADSHHQRSNSDDTQWHVPYSPSVFFTGRDTEIQQLRKQLKDCSCVSCRIGISSYGGAGKTQLMLQLAWTAKHEYTGGVYWIEADSAERLRRSVVGIAEVLGVESSIRDVQKHRECAGVVVAAILQQAQQKGKCLLCIDAADDAEVVQLLSTVYFPPELALHGDIIYTSRTSDRAIWALLAGCDPIQLGMMPPEDAAVLLFRVANGLRESSCEEAVTGMRQMPPHEQAALRDLAGNNSSIGIYFDDHHAFCLWHSWIPFTLALSLMQWKSDLVMRKYICRS